MAEQDAPLRQFQPDAFTDAQARDLVILLRDDLIGLFGPGAVLEAHPYAHPLERFGKLPGLSVHVMQDQLITGVAVGAFAQGVRRITYALTYYAPECPIDRLDSRWPLLRAIYKRCESTLLRKQSRFVNGGRELPALSALTFESVIGDYSAAALTKGVYPMVTIGAVSNTPVVLDYSEDGAEEAELLRVYHTITAGTTPVVPPPLPTRIIE